MSRQISEHLASKTAAKGTLNYWLSPQGDHGLVDNKVGRWWCGVAGWPFQCSEIAKAKRGDAGGDLVGQAWAKWGIFPSDVAYNISPRVFQLYSASPVAPRRLGDVFER
jgi:hypothetical protein